MLYAAPSLSYSPPPTVQSIVAHAALAETHLGGIPTQSVPSAIALPEARNNTRGAATPIPVFAPSAPATPVAQQLLALGRPGGAPNFSTPFFAQLLAQTPLGMQPDILLNYTPRYNTIAPETMEAFSQVKYMPSAASRPRPPAPEFAGVRAEPLPDLKTTFRQVQMELRNGPPQAEAIRLPLQAVLTPQAPVAVAAPVAPVATPAPAPVAAAPSDAAESEEPKVATPQRKRAIDAYLKALSRNAGIKPVEAAAEL